MQTPPWGIVSALIAGLLCLTLAGQGHVQAAPVPADRATPSLTPPDWGPAGLRAKAAETGRVRIIVEARELPDGSAAAAPGSAGRAAAEQRLLAHLATVPARVTRFRSLPHLALEVDEHDLETLLADPAINVYEDLRLRRALAESVPLIGAPQRWASGHDGSGQAVAVLDQGVDRYHPFLAGKVVAEACFLLDGGCAGGATVAYGEGAAQPPASCNDCDHGTHVAGIAAGKGDTFSGVAPGAELIAVRVLDTDGLGYLSDILSGLEYVRDMASAYSIAAANLSISAEIPFRTHCDNSPQSTGLKHLVDQLHAVGIATVVASGNSGYLDAIGFPACLSSVVSVAGTDRNDRVASFSNVAEILDLLAPGDVVSSVNGGGFAVERGTSMAAPHVAGALAVLRSQYPDASVGTLVGQLKFSGKPVTNVAGITRPRLDVGEAMEAALARYVGSNPRDSGSGGCTLRSASAIDPVLPLLAAVALAWVLLGGRRHRRRGG